MPCLCASLLSPLGASPPPPSSSLLLAPPPPPPEASSFDAVGSKEGEFYSFCPFAYKWPPRNDFCLTKYPKILEERVIYYMNRRYRLSSNFIILRFYLLFSSRFSCDTFTNKNSFQRVSQTESVGSQSYLIFWYMAGEENFFAREVLAFRAWETFKWARGKLTSLFLMGRWADLKLKV